MKQKLKIRKLSKKAILLIAILLTTLITITAVTTKQNQNTVSLINLYLQGVFQSPNTAIIGKDSTPIYIWYDYTFTENINNGSSIIVNGSNIVIDGNGYALIGPGPGVESGYGFDLTNADNVTIKNVVVTKWEFGFNIYGMWKNNFLNNTVYNNSIGFSLFYTTFNNFSNNTVYNNSYGFYLGSTGRNNFWNNTANNNGIGFAIYSSDYNNFWNNTANNNDFGFLIQQSPNNNFWNNTANNNGHVYYEYGYGFYISNSKNNNLTGNNASNNNYGFRVSSSDYNNFSGNTANNNDYGFYLSNSKNNNLTGNNALNNNYAFYLNSSSYNTLLDNTATAVKIYSIPVEITIQAYPTTDNKNRYHGMSLDQPLPDDFWNYPDYTFLVTPYSYTYITTKSVSPGSHYVEYASSGYVPDYAWHARIYINYVLMAEGDVGRNKHLIAYFTVIANCGFYLNSSSYNTLSDNTANNNSYGFYLEGSSTGNNLLDNTALNSTAVGYYWTAGCTNNNFTGSVEENYLQLKVTDSLGYPITGAEVKVETDGTVVYKTPYFNGTDRTTDSSGVTPWITVTYRTGTGIDQMTINVTKVTVYYHGFSVLNNSRTVNMGSSHVENFTVALEPPTLLPTMLPILLLLPRTQSSGSILVYAAVSVAAIAGVAVAAVLLYYFRLRRIKTRITRMGNDGI